MAHIVVLESFNTDILVCGTCKTIFNCLQTFTNHKNNPCVAAFDDFNQSYAYAVEEVFEKTLKSKESYNSVETCCYIDTPDRENMIIEASNCELNDGIEKSKSIPKCKMQLEKQHQCLVCGRCFGQNSHLQRHITSHKVWPDGLSETTAKSVKVDLLSYCCAYCNATLSNYSQFRAHLKNHATLKMFKCIQNDCEMLCESLQNLLEHISLYHPDKSYDCHICHDKFKCLETIALHQKEHKVGTKKNQEPKSYKCHHCDSVFKKKENLSLHILTDNHRKECLHCKKVFVSDKRLRLHLQTHKKTKSYQCNVCDASFHMKKYLSNHVLKHGMRTYSCSICKHTFKRRDILLRHFKSHQRKKEFKCPFKDSLNCVMEFSRNDKLKAHIRTHTKKLVLSSVKNKHSKEK